MMTQLSPCGKADIGIGIRRPMLTLVPLSNDNMACKGTACMLHTLCMLETPSANACCGVCTESVPVPPQIAAAA